MSELIKTITDKYHSAYTPQAWILGQAVVDRIEDYYGEQLVKDYRYNNSRKLWGLPVIIDESKPNRLDIVE